MTQYSPNEVCPSGVPVVVKKVKVVLPRLTAGLVPTDAWIEALCSSAAAPPNDPPAEAARSSTVKVPVTAAGIPPVVAVPPALPVTEGYPVACSVCIGWASGGEVVVGVAGAVPGERRWP